MKENYQMLHPTVRLMDRVHTVFVTFFIWYGVSKFTLYLSESMAETEAARASLELALVGLFGLWALNILPVLLGKRDAMIMRAKTVFRVETNRVGKDV